MGEWKNVKLGDLLEEYCDKNLNNQYVPVAVGKYGIRRREEIYTKELSKDFSKNKIISKDTLTIGMGSEQIDIGVLTENETFCVSPAYTTYKIINCDAKFLEYYLKNINSKLSDAFMIISARQGKSVDKVGLLNYKILIPKSTKEQKKITQILENVDKIIEKYEMLLENKKNYIKSLFIKVFGNPNLNPNNYPFLPFVNYMERCVDIGSNGANKVVMEHLNMKDEEDYALLVRTLNFTSNDFNNNVKYISEDAYNYFSKSKVYGGEIIFNKIGSAGMNFLMPNLYRPVSLGLNQIMITPKDINTRYLYDYLNTEFGKHDICSRVNGTVTKSIQKTELKRIPIMYPPIEIQNKYEKIVSIIEKEIIKITNTCDNYKKLKQALMQQLLIGKIKVKI